MVFAAEHLTRQVRFLFVVQKPHAGDQRGTVVLFKSVDASCCVFEGCEHAVRAVLHHVVLYRASRAGPSAALDVNVRHQVLLSRGASNEYFGQTCTPPTAPPV